MGALLARTGSAAKGVLSVGALGIRKHPAASLGGTAFAVFFTLVATNALFSQTGMHAAPLVMTRGMPHPGLETASQSIAPDPLVREIQSALSQTGHYTGAVDGRLGPATETAIERFENDNALVVTGKASESLLREAQQVANLTMPSPSPRPYDWTDGEETPMFAVNDDGRGERVLETTDSATTGSVTPSDVAAPEPDKALVRRIQAGLTAASVAELQADGIAGERTRAAIATFEALEGMDVTGKADERVLERLIQIGAI